MEPNYQEWKFWLDVLQMVATFALFVYVVLTRKSDNNSALITKMQEEQKVANNDHKERHESLKERVVRIEGRPNHEQEIVDIHKRINGVAEGQSKLAGRFDETAEAVKRIHDYMINRGH